MRSLIPKIPLTHLMLKFPPFNIITEFFIIFFALRYDLITTSFCFTSASVDYTNPDFMRSYSTEASAVQSTNKK